MKKSIYEQLGAVTRRIQAAGGTCIIMAHDGESEHDFISTGLHDDRNASGFFYNLFDAFPELIPRALCAASMAMRGNCDEESDDDDDDDDDPEDDGVPVDVCGRGCAVCLN